MTKPDLSFQDHGSVWLMTANTPDGEAWVDSHIPEDAQMLGDAVAIEHRFVRDIYEGAHQDGLEVERI